MVTVRSPLRISLGGGGTDLPSYYTHFGSFFISAAIKQYITLSLEPSVEGRFSIQCDDCCEIFETVEKIKHPIIRAVLKKFNVKTPLAIISKSDVPGGTGLGSSGAFTAALIKAVSVYQNNTINDPYALAEAACAIEMQDLKLPSGKQDSYISVFGGLQGFEIDRAGQVDVVSLGLTDKVLQNLSEKLCLFYTGKTRASQTLLRDQDQRSRTQDQVMLENLHFIKALGFQVKAAITENRLDDFGRLMHEHWQHKRQRSVGMSNNRIDHWYRLGLKNGALGGKVIGAGGGGFLMFYTNDRDKLVHEMENMGLSFLPVAFDFHGVKQIKSDDL